MRNKRYLNSHYRVRMYHRDALDEKTLKNIRGMWDLLAKEELAMVTQDKTVALMFQDQITKSKVPGFLDEKFSEYLKLVDWFYILEHNYLAHGFMAVAEDQLLSLWVSTQHRGQGKASYMVENHREIFNKPMELQCYRDNHYAMKFYQARGFVPIDETGIYTRLRLS